MILQNSPTEIVSSVMINDCCFVFFFFIRSHPILLLKDPFHMSQLSNTCLVNIDYVT